ncbi:hypothetical protein [Geomonas propionica]|uniref:Uncharacterized protein n=1 Tax=Geomonas propionica TaxID=2798582 RepID=A0ABS0YQC3_9BACT|nr:hypothetical protein [Geomonas propionica]MBJ6800139.1 hypothetical protein [Geomonas propionica]
MSTMHEGLPLNSALWVLQAHWPGLEETVRASLVTQGVDGVEAGCPARREKTKDNRKGRRKEEE